MSDGFFTCGIVPLGTGPEVFAQVNTMNQRVDQTLSQTLALADQLATYQIANVSFSIDPTPVQTYTIRDIADGLEFNDIDVGVLPAVPTIGDVSIATPALPAGEPEAPADAPSPIIPDAPVAYHPVFGPAPTIVFPTIPSYQDLTSGIPFPVLRPITLPAPPAVDFGLPFTATPPTFTARPPDPADFNYTEQAYDPLLVSEIKAAIQATLQGTTGLPRVVEDALWAREAEREAETAAAATQDAFEEMAARGFTLPNGMLQSKLMQTRQNSQNQKNSLGRDVMIRIHEVLVDQFKFGVAQGIALENAWIGLYSDIQNRRLQAAQVAINISIAVYNALVWKYQADAQLYRVEADVYASRIRAELEKLQGYSEQLRALQLIGELNEQDVRIYQARLSAVETNVRVYVAEIQAYSEKINGEKLKLDTYRTQIEVEDEKLKASQQEFEIWTGQLRGQELIQQSYATRAQTYLGNVQAWRTKYEAQIDRQRGEIAAAEASTARYQARIQGIVAIANALVARAQALVADNTARVQKRTSDVAATTAYNTALAEKIKGINDANAQNTQIALKNGEINAQNALAVYELIEKKLQAALQVLSQITASFASSVNMNASVSDSTAFGQSCSYQTSQTVG